MIYFEEIKYHLTTLNDYRVSLIAIPPKYKSRLTSNFLTFNASN